MIYGSGYCPKHTKTRNLTHFTPTGDILKGATGSNDINPPQFALFRALLNVHTVEDTEADLVDGLRATGSLILSLVAIEGQDVVGHIAFSPVRIDSTSGTQAAVGLGPLGVLPAYQRRGIGSELVRAALADLRKAGHGIVVVLGHPDFYPRFGFVPAENHGVRWEHDAPSEAFMVKELITGTLQGVRGIAKFRPEFNDV